MARFITPDQARVYLVQTARPGGTMRRQGAVTAIGRLHPQFAVNLANSVYEARQQGIDAQVFSAYRPPGYGVGGFADKFRSLHAYGAAIDMAGVGRPGSDTAKTWYEIATKNGLHNPYGPNHKKEWNHFQAIPQKAADEALRATVNKSGPIDLTKMWAAVDAASGGILSSRGQSLPDMEAIVDVASAQGYLPPKEGDEQPAEYQGNPFGVDKQAAREFAQYGGFAPPEGTPAVSPAPSALTGYLPEIPRASFPNDAVFAQAPVSGQEDDGVLAGGTMPPLPRMRPEMPVPGGPANRYGGLSPEMMMGSGRTPDTLDAGTYRSRADTVPSPNLRPSVPLPALPGGPANRFGGMEPEQMIGSGLTPDAMSAGVYRSRADQIPTPPMRPEMNTGFPGQLDYMGSGNLPLPRMRPDRGGSMVAGRPDVPVGSLPAAKPPFAAVRPEGPAAGMPAETLDQMIARMQAEKAAMDRGIDKRAGTPVPKTDYYRPDFDFAAGPGPIFDPMRAPTQGAVSEPSMAFPPSVPSNPNMAGRFADAFGAPTKTWDDMYRDKVAQEPVFGPGLGDAFRRVGTGALDAANDFFFSGAETGLSDAARWMNSGGSSPASASTPAPIIPAPRPTPPPPPTSGPDFEYVFGGGIGDDTLSRNPYVPNILVDPPAPISMDEFDARFGSTSRPGEVTTSGNWTEVADATPATAPVGGIAPPAAAPPMDIRPPSMGGPAYAPPQLAPQPAPSFAQKQQVLGGLLGNITQSLGIGNMPFLGGGTPFGGGSAQHFTATKQGKHPESGQAWQSGGVGPRGYPGGQYVNSQGQTVTYAQMPMSQGYAVSIG